jgi:hypothetical protein
MLAISMPLCAQSPQISPPLNDGEKRRILGQLYELHSCRDEVRAYRDYVSRDTELESREKASADRALDLERQAAALARRERDLERDRANTYEQLYRSVTKKPGIGCRLARILTLGLARCR